MKDSSEGRNVRAMSASEADVGTSNIPVAGQKLDEVVTDRLFTV